MGAWLSYGPWKSPPHQPQGSALKYLGGRLFLQRPSPGKPGSHESHRSSRAGATASTGWEIALLLSAVLRRVDSSRSQSKGQSRRRTCKAFASRSFWQGDPPRLWNPGFQWGIRPHPASPDSPPGALTLPGPSTAGSEPDSSTVGDLFLETYATNIIKSLS